MKPRLNELIGAKGRAGAVTRPLNLMSRIEPWLGRDRRESPETAHRSILGAKSAKKTVLASDSPHVFVSACLDEN